MFNLSTQGVDVDSLVAQKRQGAIEAQKSSYGANVEYAKALNLKFEFDWFAVSHTDSSDEGKAVRKEKELFFVGLKEIGHSNPSKVWKDVRDYGLILGRLGLPHMAMIYLERYAKLAPTASDIESIRYHAKLLLGQVVS
jgi:hypothetical protein